jgi:aryl-alcohol dehydrogenase-like predicted oxidoreductase
MDTRTIGTTDLEVSTIALGCWPMGAGYWGRADDDVSIRTLHKALEAGITHVDTAPAYGHGHSETVVGRALIDRRADVVLSTKVAADPDGIRDSLDASLARLQTDYVDVCYVHWPRRSTPLARTMEMLESLRAEGRLRAIGVSNFTVAMMEMASNYGRIDVIQPPYNLIWRFIEEDVLPYCVAHDIGVVTYSSLAQGLLTGTLRLNTAFAGDDQRVRSVLWQPENYGKCLYAVERLRPIAESLGISLTQLALRWLAAQPGVTSALVGARTPEEIAEDAAALDGATPEATMDAIQAVSDEIYVSMPYYYDMWGNWRTWNRRGPQRER